MFTLPRLQYPHGLILYCPPSPFSRQPIEWEETLPSDKGMLGLTTKHIYFTGTRILFRARYDRIVSLGSYENGFGIMRNAETAKPHTIRTGDGWFAHNLTANLAQLKG